MSMYSDQRRYVRVGPFGQGIYVNVPCHIFGQIAPQDVPTTIPGKLRSELWRCACCGTIVSSHRSAEAGKQGCDGTMRCAICNARIPHGRGSGSWAGIICPLCAKAHRDALTVHPAPQVGQTASQP